MTWLTLIYFAYLLVVCSRGENGHCPEFILVKKTHAVDMSAKIASLNANDNVHGRSKVDNCGGGLYVHIP